MWMLHFKWFHHNLVWDYGDTMTNSDNLESDLLYFWIIENTSGSYVCFCDILHIKWAGTCHLHIPFINPKMVLGCTSRVLHYKIKSSLWIRWGYWNFAEHWNYLRFLFGYSLLWSIYVNIYELSFVLEMEKVTDFEAIIMYSQRELQTLLAPHHHPMSSSDMPAL